MRTSAINRETQYNDVRRSKRLAELSRVYTINLADLEEAEIRRKIFINFNTLSNITVPKTYEKAIISREAPSGRRPLMKNSRAFVTLTATLRLYSRLENEQSSASGY